VDEFSHIGAAQQAQYRMRAGYKRNNTS
jgi:hypothetical protein